MAELGKKCDFQSFDYPVLTPEKLTFVYDFLIYFSDPLLSWCKYCSVALKMDMRELGHPEEDYNLQVFFKTYKWKDSALHWVWSEALKEQYKFVGWKSYSLDGKWKDTKSSMFLIPVTYLVL